MLASSVAIRASLTVRCMPGVIAVSACVLSLLVLGQHVGHLLLGQDVRCPDGQRLAVQPGQHLDTLGHIGGLIQAGARGDQPVVGEQHGQRRRRERIAHVRGQRFGSVGGVAGHLDLRRPGPRDHVVHGRDRQAEDGQRRGVRRVGVHDRGDVGPALVDQAVQRRLRRRRALAVAHLAVQADDDDVGGLDPVVLQRGRRDADLIAADPDAEVSRRLAEQPPGQKGPTARDELVAGRADSCRGSRNRSAAIRMHLPTLFIPTLSEQLFI